MSGKRRAIGILAPLLVAGGLVVLAWFWLSVFTRHNAKAEVPELKGLTFDEAKAKLAERDLGIEVIDSVYNDQAAKGSVVEQNPRAGRTVKPDRTVYVVMNSSQPKMLNMPALVNLSKRQALSVLEIIGIKVREVQYRPDPCLDCVVAQLYKGQPIAPEARIRRGESITLVLGSGQNGERVQVPDLHGMTKVELRDVLTMAELGCHYGMRRLQYEG
jgi:eukaryotic-like serine/threonine-protein kinase